MIRIQYASNLFVNQNASWRQAARKLTPSCEILALCGNIGIPSTPQMNNFLSWCSHNWNTILWIPGPMELSQLHARPFSVPAENISILYKTVYPISQKTNILGAPLWTPHSPTSVRFNERDLYFMAYRSPILINQWHDDQYNFLKKNIAVKSKKSIVLTHHLPHASLLNSEQWTERNILLYSARAQELFAHESVLGILSGAGGQTITSMVGKYDISCSVNGAFTGPDMVPNPHFRSDMIAHFVED